MPNPSDEFTTWGPSNPGGGAKESNTPQSAYCPLCFFANFLEFPISNVSFLLSELILFINSEEIGTPNSESSFLNYCKVFYCVYKCEKTLLLIRSSQFCPCWIKFNANPSKLKGYWNEVLIGI